MAKAILRRLAAAGAILLLVAAPLAAQAPTPARLQVTTSLDPATLTPGTEGLLNVVLTNIGQSAAGGITITVADAPVGLSLTGAGSTIAGSLGAGETGNRALQVAAAPEMPTGRYLIQLLIQYCSVTGATCPYSSFAHTLSIHVVDTADIQIVSVEPQRLSRSGSEDLVIRLHNPSSSRFEDITLTWTTPGDALLPLGQDSTMTLATLAAGASFNFTVPVVVASGAAGTPGAGSGAAGGSLPITITITYRDITGQARSLESRVGLEIGGPAAFDVGSATLENEALTLTLGNVGENGASSVVLRALDAAGRTLGTTFLGAMDPGDFATLTVSLGPDVEAADIASVRIDYTDEVGDRREQTLPLQATSPPPEIATGPGPGTITLVAVLAVAAIVAVVVIVRRRRRED